MYLTGWVRFTAPWSLRLPKVTANLKSLFRHNQTYWEPCVTVAYLELHFIHNFDRFRTKNMCRAMAYSQPEYIQDFSIFWTLAYSESCQISTMNRFWKMVNSYNYFQKLITFAKLAAFRTSWNKYLEVVSPELGILY